MAAKGIQSSVVGVALPGDFDVVTYDRIAGRVAGMPTRPPHKWQQFGPGWSAVAYRFVGTAAADDALRASLSRFGPHPIPRRRVEQELAIFAFLTNACATVASYFFALYSLGWIIDPTNFPLLTEKDRRSVDVQMTVDQYGRHFGQDQLWVTLAAIPADQDWLELTTWRNVVSHQAAPGRLVRPGIATDWRVGLHRGRSPDMTEISEPKRKWLSATLGVLLSETDSFLTRRGIPG